ncbi:hypothetical protein LAZ67_15000814 [Cordylochernes scorpioides]|uniref:Transposase n=1 Tax=Cordylochernes scorpioides TaxID=51811 RepID=A0ABY6LAT8_9ARAC|nr:hypothetical protein LAZ67_15000814 [Cordylochernes scorpioides]
MRPEGSAQSDAIKGWKPFLEYDRPRKQRKQPAVVVLDGHLCRLDDASPIPAILGREKVNDDQHTGRPRSFRCEENKLKIKELIKSNRRIIFRDWTICLYGDNEQNNDWILHVGNARPHTAHVVLQFLAKHSTIQIPHPPYSPDLAPNDFFLYPKLKMNLKGRKFDNVDMIQAESKATLRNLSKSDFISCFDNWKKRWNRCIEAGGAYFEKY